MRFIEVFEGINMGMKALKSPPRKDYTVGLEIEVYTDQESDSSDFIDNAFERFSNTWDGYSEYTIEDYIKDIDVNQNKIQQIIKDYEPLYDKPDITYDTLRNMFGQEKIDNAIKVFDRVTQDNFDWDKVKDDKELEKLAGFDFEKNTISGIKLIIGRKFLNFGIDRNGIKTNLYVADEDGEVYFLPDEVETMYDLEKWFDINVEDYFEEDYYELMSDREQEDFSDYLDTNIGNSGEISYVQEVLSENDFHNYDVVPDETPRVSAEILTPPQQIDKTISDMEGIFSLFDDNDIETNENCGLHVNIGTWKDDYNNVDWFKFMVVFNSQHVLKEFGRLSNQFARDKLQNIITSIETSKSELYRSSTKDFNSFVLNNLDKFSAINFKKLIENSNNRYIEIRAAGGQDYHKNPEKIENVMRRAVRALEIASDPNAYKKEYLKMLYKIAPPKTNVTIHPLDKIETKLNIHNPYKTLEGLLTGIIYKDIPSEEVDKALSSDIIRFTKSPSFKYYKIQDTDEHEVIRNAKSVNREDLLDTKLFRLFLK